MPVKLGGVARVSVQRAHKAGASLNHQGFDTTRHKTASHSTAGFRYDSPKDGESLNHQPRLNLPLASLTVVLASSARSGGSSVRCPVL